MAFTEGKYNIKAVSKMLGIQPGTLRAWERRYQFIAPVRNDSGHRLYTDEHVRILRWLIDKTNQGFTISQAVTLLERQEVLSHTYIPEEMNGDQTKNMSSDLLDALLKFEENKAHELINQAFAMFSIEKVVIDILGSILVKIGDLWENGKITTAHEHFASSIVRSRIGFIMHTLPQNTLLPKAVAVCAPNESHEFGILIFTLFLRRKGFEVIYLGGSLETKDLFTVIDTVKPKFLFMSCTMKGNVDDTFSLVKDLQSKFTHLEIGLGGIAMEYATELDKEVFSDQLLGNDKTYWEKWLASKIN
ncbi:MerR family transcriptional regulator [Peribacillus alkalitolerans]|uniref:MerR family transcriptional regulator n=1 Tax=Peribacillus alkalitolerans TaxID=1550385 RepID=UPI0013D6E951|nr:MerR family transcriptional regulator [Peribacillus alkalitolerans]